MLPAQANNCSKTASRISLRDNYTNFENGNNQSLNNLSNQGTEHDKFNQLVDRKLSAAEVADLIAFLSALDCPGKLEKPKLP